MKKLLAILICAIMCVTLLSSCDMFKHEHIKGEWGHNETQHWQGVTCTWNKCDFDMDPADHFDENENDICDVCGFEYELIFKLTADESGYELDRVGPGYKGGDIVIPSEYKGLPVVEIGYSAFTSEYKLTSVDIPDTVTLIDSDAFEKQTSLTSVYVGKGVVTIGVSAFEGCTNLKTVVISDATEFIYAGAFRDCTSLETVTLGKNVKEITGYVFRGCTSLKTITIPASIVEMGAWVFEDTNMTDVYFGVSAPGENWHEEWADGLEGVNLHWTEVEAIDLAQIVLDYEQSLRDDLAKLRAEHPEYNYYYHSVNEVHCTLILNREASADAIVTKYDMNNLFASAEISALNAIKMVSINFERNEFTEDMHQKIKQISENEVLVENLFIDMYRGWYQSYMPKIEYYTDDAKELSYTATSQIISVFDSKDVILKSKDEYDAYLEELLETAEYDYEKERITAARDLYDETFFDENALIITRMITRGSSSIKLTVNNLYVSDDKVYVVIRTDDPKVCDDAMLHEFFGLAVKKSDVVNVNEVITLD